MPSTNPNTILVACPGCGARYDFPPSMAGKRGRCARCHEPLTVPAPKENSVPLDEMPQYIGVECHLCGTRMYGGPDQVGKEIKCPDCGARTVLPPPPKPKKQNIPAAMYGDQYELWEPDEASRPAELLAHQPKYIAVKCQHCDTLMYATEKQVGEKIACPDCGTMQAVPAPVKPKPARSPLRSAGEIPILDPAAAPGERPPSLLPEGQQRIYEEQVNTDYAKALEKARRTGKPLEVDSRDRPILPRWPLITGVLPFLVSPGVPARWLGVSIGFFMGGYVFIAGLQMAAQGGFGAIGGMSLFAAGCIITLICAAVASGYFIAIVTESSEGNKQIQDWPFAFDWFGHLLAVIVAGMVSGFPGWIIARFVLEDPFLQMVAFAASMLLCFPVVLMSQLDIGSPWGVTSPRIVTSMIRCPFSWLTFYVETAVLIAGCIAALSVAPSLLVALVILSALGTAGWFLYGRLLGRLGWRLAEAE